MTSLRNAALVLSAFAAFAAPSPGRAEQAASVCIYASKNYSEGALLCVQRSIALICGSDGTRPAWTTVTDRDLADRCAGPDAYSRPHPHVRTAFRARHHDLPIGTAKCFEFNGKQYCE